MTSAGVLSAAGLPRDGRLVAVGGRNDVSSDETLRLDLKSVDKTSMRLDLQTFWRTARAVLSGAGAY